MAEQVKPPAVSYEPFFFEELKSVPEPISKILQDYSGVPPDQQTEHILKVRNRAYKAYPYPCLGRFRFLELDISRHPQYKEYVLPILTGVEQTQGWKPVFLDLSSCLGQDLRKLAFDGVNPQWLWGSDIHQDFIDAGYELFRDEHKMPKDHFICPADVFDNSEGNNLSVLDGRVDMMHVTAVFHLFNREQEDLLAARCLRLLNKNRPSGVDGLIFGSQVGNIDAREFVRANGSRRYRHNEQSWRKMWESVCNREEFKSKVKGVKVEVELRHRSMDQMKAGELHKHIGKEEEGFRWMVWTVWIEFTKG
ncbi:hypothetical protein H2198_002707 [Neophaeococcomyces mojaviensis]|uniref:Uncharacterized protein n=1 Tax=Neophaeococcomyces mojaviensis TaxID=3383035 RepID=A0ACC3ADK0_9EURO|nr:hypothetical protein H2198_002707 [Knufia sp. JES_112]